MAVVWFQNIYDIIRGQHGQKKKDGKTGSADKGSGVTGLRDIGHEDMETANALAAAYTEAVNSRKKYLKDFQDIRNFYLVDAIFGLVLEDALTPDVTTGEVVELRSKNAKINRSLQELQNKINMDNLIHEIVPDLLSMGEYAVRQEVKKGEGVVDLHDDVDQAKFVAFYKRGLPNRFAKMEKQDIKLYSPYHYAHFCLGRQKLRIDLKKEFKADGKKQTAFPEDLPAYARVGRPLLYGVFSKIKELQLLESLIPATKLNDIMSGTLVGVSMPVGTEPKDAFATIKRYEQLFNAKTGIDKNTDQISLRHILGVAGKVKAIPIFGEKGRLEQMSDVKRNPSIDDLLNTVQDNRSVILTSIGIPPELLYANEDGGKAATLKKYARYLRTLKALQTSIALGLKQIAIVHLVNSGHRKVSLRDIEVTFRNEIISIDELEKLEFVDAVVTMLSSLHSFAGELQESSVLAQDSIDKEKFQSWLHSTLALVIKNANFVKPVSDAETDVTKPKISKSQQDQLVVEDIEDIEDSLASIEPEELLGGSNLEDFILVTETKQKEETT